MKIRTDFVTNSSSSSFILGFKSATIGNITSEILSYSIPDEYKIALINDVTENKITKSTAKKQIIEYVESNAIFSARVNGKSYFSSNIPYDEFLKHPDVADFIKELKEAAVKEFLEKTKNYKYFSKVSYSDNDGDFGREMEHEIVPYISSCIKRFNNH